MGLGDVPRDLIPRSSFAHSVGKISHSYFIWNLLVTLFIRRIIHQERYMLSEQKYNQTVRINLIPKFQVMLPRLHTEQ